MIFFISFELTMVVCLLFSIRSRHTRCALVTGVQTFALPFYSRLFYVDDSWISPAACRCCAGGDVGLQLYGGTDPRSCPMGYSCTPIPRRQIGRESCRVRVCRYE